MRRKRNFMALFLVVTMLAGQLPAQALATKVPIPEELPAGVVTPVTETQEREVSVVGEDESRREENVKHFILSDGSRRAVLYSEPVHYEENGKWKDIDNTLQYNETSGTYENKANAFTARFDENPESDKLLMLENNGYVISWEYVEQVSRQRITRPEPKPAQKGLQREVKDEAGKPMKSVGEPLRYEEMEPSCDIEYTVTGDGVKENIILSEKTHQNSFTFQVTMPEMKPVIKSDGSISIKAKDNKEEVFHIPAPFMYDAEEAYSEAVAYEVKELDKDVYELIITADREWLSDEERVYPVVIDPVITTKQKKSAIDTTFIAEAEAYENENLNAMTYTYVGWETSEYGQTRTLIKIDLPDLNPGDMVVNAELNIFQSESKFYASTVGKQQINAHRIITSWKAGEVTWKTSPNIDSTVYDYNFIDRESGGVWQEFNITKAVKLWYEGTEPNHGIMLKQAVEDGTMANHAAHSYLWSDKYNEVSGLYPLIFIDYRNNKGVEDYWSYTTLGAGAAGNAYVNDYSGNLVFDAPLASSAGNRMNIGLNLVYNGYCANEKYVSGKEESYKTVVGKGYRLNVQQTVLPSTKYGLTGSSATLWPYVYTDGDGTEHYFYKLDETKTIDGTTYQYQDEGGQGLYLTTTPDESVAYQISDENGNSMYFNTKGNLRHWKNANKDKVTITFRDRDGDGTRDKDKIDYITDANGHKYTFTYRNEEEGTDDFVKKITDDAGRVITFYYETGLLSRIHYPDGTNSYFTYAGDTNVLKTAYDQDKTGLEFTYETIGNKNKRVKQVREIAQATDGTMTRYGQRITFDRSNYNKTIIQTAGIDGIHEKKNAENKADDVITTYQFDDLGRTVSQQVKYGNGVEAGAGAYQYTSTDTDETVSDDKNKIRNQAGLGQNTVNLVKNSNVTGWSNWTKATSTGAAEESTYTTAGQVYMGERSFCINNMAMSAACNTYIKQECTDFTVGATYTFSAYVKTSNVTQAFSTGKVGAFIQVGMFNSGNTALQYFSTKALTKTTDTAIDNGWRRLSVTFTVPENTAKMVLYLCQNNTTGYVWFDCMQLETGNVANDYNMVENSSFEYSSNGMPTGWTTSTITYSANSSGTVQNGVTTARAKKGSRSMRIIGEATKAKGLSQTIAVEGNPNDTYILSAWAYANAVKKTDWHSGTKFHINVEVHYNTTTGSTTGTTTQAKDKLEFNSCVSGWQYGAVPIVLAYNGGTSGTTYTPTAIEITCRYSYQENSAYFDHIQLIKDVAPAYQYDSKGNVTSVAANAKQKENMTYEGKDVKTYKDPLGNVTNFTYDSNHNLLTMTSPKGIVSGYTYNSHGQVTASEVRDKATSSSATMIIKTENEYNAASGSINEGAYVVKEKDADGRETAYTYNYQSGMLQKVTDVAGNETTYTYENGYGKLTQVASGDAKVNYTYNGNRLDTITAGSATDRAERELYQLEYDAYGNNTATKVGNVALARNTYVNYNGLLQSSQYGNGDEIKYVYDKMGNISMIYQKQDSNASFDQYSSYLWQYATDGTPMVYQDGKNQLRYEYMYDSIGRLIRQNISKTTDSTQVGYTEFGYDNRNYLTKMSNKIGSQTQVQNYRYDADGLPSEYSLSTGQYGTYSYDKLGRLTGRYFYHSDAGSSPVIRNSYTYLTSERGGNYTTAKIGSEEVQGLPYDYTYDLLGNITDIDIGGYTYCSYEYDEKSQLTRENHSVNWTTKTWEYDALGNIQNMKKYNYTSGTSLQNPKEVVTYNYGTDTDAGWNYLLTGITTQLYTGSTVTSTITETIDYDAIGNPISYRGATMGWFGRQMTSYSKNGTGITNTYDANGIRGSKTVNGSKTTYQYLDGQLQYEKRGDGKELYYLYDSTGTLFMIRMCEDGDVEDYYVSTNWQGDVLALFTADKTKVAEYEYDAWGNATIYKTNENGSLVALDSTEEHIGNINPIRYRGYFYDSDMGLYYLQSRYYDAGIGRFINADSLISTGQDINGFNMFAYCGNNPVNRVDPTGECGIANRVQMIFKTTVKCIRKVKQTVQNTLLTEEQKVFVATIAGEAISEKAAEQKAVAHTIMNRVKEPREAWSNVTCVLDVLSSNIWYNAVGGKEYNKCMEYLLNRDGRNASYEELISNVIPIYYGEEIDFTGGAHFIFNIENGQSKGLLNELRTQPNRYVQCAPIDGVDSDKFCMFRCLW